MTLVELHVDVARVANALEQIVDLLKKLVEVPPERDVKVHQATLDDLHIVSPEDLARQQQEQMAFAELHRVVPGSEAFDQELLEYAQRQRSIHGEDWQAPDWAEAFITAAGGRPVRERAEERETSSSSAGHRSA